MPNRDFVGYDPLPSTHQTIMAIQNSVMHLVSAWVDTATCVFTLPALKKDLVPEAASLSLKF